MASPEISGYLESIKKAASLFDIATTYDNEVMRQKQDGLALEIGESCITLLQTPQISDVLLRDSSESIRIATFNGKEYTLPHIYTELRDTGGVHLVCVNDFSIDNVGHRRFPDPTEAFTFEGREWERRISGSVYPYQHEETVSSPLDPKDLLVNDSKEERYPYLFNLLQGMSTVFDETILDIKQRNKQDKNLVKRLTAIHDALHGQRNQTRMEMLQVSNDIAYKRMIETLQILGPVVPGETSIGELLPTNDPFRTKNSQIENVDDKGEHFSIAAFRGLLEGIDPNTMFEARELLIAIRGTWFLTASVIRERKMQELLDIVDKQGLGSQRIGLLKKYLGDSDKQEL